MAEASGAVNHSVAVPLLMNDARLNAPALLQIVFEEAVNVGVAGVLDTVMVDVAVFVHPLASVPVTVYVLVLVGVAITLDPLTAESSVDGLQV